MFGKDAIIVSLKLFVITAIAALCLSFVNKVTAPIIVENSAAAEAAALREVLGAAQEFSGATVPEGVDVEGVTVQKVNVGLSNSEKVGYVVTAVSNAGYGGDIKVMVGIDNNLSVTRIQILESAETAGLGANASKPKFSGQFEGAKEALTVVKGDAGENEISAIASATITSKAVTSCVNAALETAKELNNSNVAENVEETAKKLEEIKAETQKQLVEGAEEQKGEGE